MCTAAISNQDTAFNSNTAQSHSQLSLFQVSFLKPHVSIAAVLN
jgi:hypothetical protein